MSLRVVIDQSHGEFLTIDKTEIFQTLLAEMRFILFPLIDRPITFEKIKDDHILFLGCPSIPFKEAEIQVIARFVEQGRYLILISGSGGDYANNTNLSEIARRFEFEFNPDYVEDEKHFFNFSRIPIIHKIKKNPITKQVKRLVYSGCSLSILDSSPTPVLFTDSDAIPMNSPIMVISGGYHVIGIGGYSFFTDDPLFGIKAKDNIRLVYNLFNFIKTHYLKNAKLPLSPSPAPKRRKKLNLKSAKKQFLKLISSHIKKMNEISNAIDKYWEAGSFLIKKQLYQQAELTISTEYHKLLQTIDTIAREIGDNFSELNDLFPNFKETILGDFNKWYEIEAEIRAKLDMIRNNLKTILKQEQLSN
ncbi:MAG: hypothetical protein ACTSRS_10625 [Candidatus Helarchaeota archaeon]